MFEPGIGLVKHAQLRRGSFICGSRRASSSPPERPTFNGGVEHGHAILQACPAASLTSLIEFGVFSSSSPRGLALPRSIAPEETAWWPHRGFPPDTGRPGKSLGGALGRIDSRDALAIVREYGPRSTSLIVRRQKCRTGRLARAVSDHDGGHFAGLDCEVEPRGDLVAVSRYGLKVLDFKIILPLCGHAPGSGGNANGQGGDYARFFRNNWN